MAPSHSGILCKLLKQRKEVKQKRCRCQIPCFFCPPPPLYVAVPEFLIIQISLDLDRPIHLLSLSSPHPANWCNDEKTLAERPGQNAHTHTHTKTNEYICTFNHTVCTCSQIQTMSCRQTGKVIQTDVHFPETLASHMAFGSGICAHKLWPRQIGAVFSLTAADCGFDGRNSQD